MSEENEKELCSKCGEATAGVINSCEACLPQCCSNCMSSLTKCNDCFATSSSSSSSSSAVSSLSSTTSMTTTAASCDTESDTTTTSQPTQTEAKDEGEEKEENLDRCGQCREPSARLRSCFSCRRLCCYDCMMVPSYSEDGGVHYCDQCWDIRLGTQSQAFRDILHTPIQRDTTDGDSGLQQEQEQEQDDGVGTNVIDIPEELMIRGFYLHNLRVNPSFADYYATLLTAPPLTATDEKEREEEEVQDKCGACGSTTSELQHCLEDGEHGCGRRFCLLGSCFTSWEYHLSQCPLN